MKLISLVLIILFLTPMMALSLNVNIGIGKRSAKKTVSTQKISPKTDTKEKVSAKKDKPEYLEKAEKLLKVDKKKRDWVTLSAESVGAFGAAYGIKRSDWITGTIGAAVLTYGLFSKRNTNSFTEQTVMIVTGIGGAYSIKQKKDNDGDKNNIVPPTPSVIPPPPAP